MQLHSENQEQVLRIHALLPHSYVNGPGRRTVIWVQGCHTRCPGCANPSTWDVNGGQPATVEELEQYIIEAGTIEGITLTGGEPLLQPAPLLELVRRVKRQGLTVVTFTGYTVQKIHKMKDAAIWKLYKLSDLVVAGPYVQAQPPTHPLTGSGNQRIVCHNEGYLRYAEQDRIRASGELRIDPDGGMTLTGFLPPSAVEKITKNS